MIKRIPAAITTGALVVVAVAAFRRASGTAPVVFEDSVEVGCAAVKAFDFLLNTDRHAVGPGSPVLRMERIPDAEARVGTRWREVIRLGCLGHMTVWSEIAALDPPTRLELRFRMPGATGTLTYRIDPGVERETCISQQQTFVVTAGLAAIGRWMIERMWKPRAAARLQDIRATLEAHEEQMPTLTAEATRCRG